MTSAPLARSRAAPDAIVTEPVVIVAGIGLKERLATATELIESDERCWLLLKTAEAFEPVMVRMSGREVGEPASVLRMTEPKRMSRMLPLGCACGPEMVRVPVPVLVRVLAEGALRVP